MSGIIAVGNKHITSALNTEDKHHVRANPEKPSPVLCCCSPPSPLEWPVNTSPVTPIPQTFSLFLSPYKSHTQLTSLGLHLPTSSTRH